MARPRSDSYTFAIAEQGPGTVTFTIAGKPQELVVTNNVYNDMSELTGSETMAVIWENDVGRAGPFSPSSGLKCFAFAHRPNNDKQIGSFSYVAP